MLEDDERLLLVRIDERVYSLTTHFSNHIRHHWMVTIPVIMVALGLIVALLVK